MMVDRNNRLTVLAAEIVAAHQASMAATATALARAVDAGRLLIEARQALPHGRWLPWLEQLGLSPRTAQAYMALARLSPEDAQRVAHLSLRQALQYVRGQRSPGNLPATGASAAADLQRRALRGGRLISPAMAGVIGAVAALQDSEFQHFLGSERVLEVLRQRAVD